MTRSTTDELALIGPQGGRRRAASCTYRGRAQGARTRLDPDGKEAVPRERRHYRRALRLLLSALGTKLIAAVDAEGVWALYVSASNTSQKPTVAPGQPRAEEALQVARRLWNFARYRGFCATNPFRAIRCPLPMRHARLWTCEELSRFVTTADAGNRPEIGAAAVREAARAGGRDAKGCSSGIASRVMAIKSVRTGSAVLISARHSLVSGGLRAGLRLVHSFAGPFSEREVSQRQSFACCRALSNGKLLSPARTDRNKFPPILRTYRHG
jgi:hypothetical protein